MVTVQPVQATQAMALAPLTGGACQVLTAQPACVHLDLYQGDDFTLALDVVDETGQPLDVSAAVVASHIRPDPAGGLAGEFQPEIQGSTILLHLTSAVSSGLPLAGVWDVQITDDGGQVTTLAAGNITLTPEVTRP